MSDAGESFQFEFQSKLNSEAGDLRTEAESRLRELATGHKDTTGASVAVRQAAHAETPFFEARVVVYMKPKNVASHQKQASPMGALKGALDAVERQVRKRRGKLRTRTRGREAG